jgi:hypothetical protein
MVVIICKEDIENGLDCLKRFYEPDEELISHLMNLTDPGLAPLCFIELLEKFPYLAVSKLGSYLRTIDQLYSEEARTLYLDEALQSPVAPLVLMKKPRLLFDDIYPTIKGLHLEEYFARNGFSIKETPIDLPGFEKEVSIEFGGYNRNQVFLRVLTDYTNKTSKTQ